MSWAGEWTDDRLSRERQSLTALASVEGVGPATLMHWYHTYGTFCNVWTASGAEVECGIGRKHAAVVTRILEMKRKGPLDLPPRPGTEYGDVWVLTWFDADYPGRLRTIPGAPWVLYGIGDLGALSAALPALAVVGTRRPTPYGRRVAGMWTAALAARGVVIISGLARGIDGIAHRAALEGGGRTVAVLAGGFDHLYPPEHRELARQVAARGALISEYPPEQLPQPGLFPVRNRLISGLADGVLVIEAGEKSGALGTAGHALDQGREVLAVPGPVMSPASQGVNRLIQDGAKAVLDVNDIVVEFPSWSLPSGEGEQPAILSWALSGAEKLVMAAIEQGFQTPDLILGQTGLRREEVSRALTALELSGKIRRQAGGLYEPTPFPSR